ncbi:MAG: hypothetical protein AAGI37_01395 [Planctomycetota bacterium]
MPDQRHLYMLVAGVLIGVLMGPAVLGRVSAPLYDQLFTGSGDTTELEAAQAELDDFLTNEDTRIARIEGIMAQAALLDPGDTAYISAENQAMALTNAFADEQAQLEANIKLARVPVLAKQELHRKKLSGMATMMLLLIVLLFAAEAILSPQRDELESGKTALPPALSRLVTIRYGLAAGWLMLMLAQPVWLQGIGVLFGGLLLAVVLVAGLVPLGKSGA